LVIGTIKKLIHKKPDRTGLEEEFKIMKKKLDSLSDDAHTRKMLNYLILMHGLKVRSAVMPSRKWQQQSADLFYLKRKVALKKGDF